MQGPALDGPLMRIGRTGVGARRAAARDCGTRPARRSQGQL